MSSPKPYLMMSVGLLSFGLMSSTFAGNLPTLYIPYNWTNGSGDRKLQTAANWEGGVAPKIVSATPTVNGESPSLFFPEGAGVISNTAASFNFGRFVFNGTSPVTADGAEWYLIGNSAFWTNTCPVIFETDFKASAWSMGSFQIKNSVDFKKSFTITGGYYCFMYINRSIPEGIHFRGPFNIKSNTMSYGYNGLRIYPEASTPIYFHDAVNVRSNTVFQSSNGQGANLYFYGPINGISLRVQSYRFNLENANILSPTGRIDWAGARAYGIVNMKGHDQVVGSLAGTYLDGSTAPAAGERVITSATPATLTVKCAPSAATPVSVQGRVNVVIDAKTSDGVQTFEYRDSTTEGMLIVSNGTLRLAKGAKFSKVMSIFVGANGTLEVDADNGVDQPFPSLLALTTEPGATVTLGSGAFPAGIDPTKAYSTSTAAADTVWAGASGDWATAAGWSAGVPTASTSAAIIGSASGQHVAITAPATAAKDLLVVAPQGTTAKLAVGSALTLANATVALKGDTELEVGNGGTVVDTGVVDTKRATHTIDLGARLTVKNGGTFKMMDSADHFQVGGTGAGKLTIEEGGLFEFDPGKLGARFVGTGAAELDIRGTLAINRRYEDNSNINFNFVGDKVRLSGNGKFLSQGAIQRSNSAAVGGASTYFYADDIELSDHAAIAADKGLNWRSGIHFRGKGAGSDTTIVFKDDASISNSFFNTTFSASSKGTMFVDMSQVQRGFTMNGQASGARADIGYTISFGGGSGRTRFDYGGIGFGHGSYNFSVGTANGSSGSTADDPGYTELNLMNGAYVSSSGACAIERSHIGAMRLGGFYGVQIGTWNNPKADLADRLLRGRLTLRDANTKFTTAAGHVVVGLGRGQGEYVQMDGVTQLGTSTGWAGSNKDEWLPKEEQVTYKVYATNSVFMLGAYGGRGECIISNGTFHSNLRTYIGGITTNQYFDGAYISLGTALNLTDAEGYLRIMGGSCTNVNPVYVGVCGTGTIEIGPRGSFTAGTVVLSNQTASVLSFKLDAANGYRSGASSVKKLVVTDGTSLKVDLGDYHGSGKVLLAYAEKEGDFQPAKIELAGDYAREYEVIVAHGIVRLRHNVGVTLLLR